MRGPRGAALGAGRAGLITCLLVSVAYVIPLAFCTHFPGGDLPWHAAAAAVYASSDTSQFLGYFTVDVQMSSYLALFAVLDVLARVVGDVAIAMQLVIAGFVVGFVMAARFLLVAFGKPGVLAVLAAPAAYCLTLEYGFLSYALSYPLTLVLWALCKRATAAGDSTSVAIAVRGLLAVAVMAAIAVSHPFAAVIAAAGAIVLLAVDVRRDTAVGALAVAAGVVVGVVPAVVAAAGVAPMSAVPIPEEVARGGLLDKLQFQVFTSLPEALAAVPARLFGFVPVWARYAAFGLGLSALVVARHVRLTPEPVRRGHRSAALLLAGLFTVYLITPFDAYWPRYWHVVQPRHLPLLWVLAVVVLAPPGAAADRRSLVRVAAGPAVVAVAMLVGFAASWAPFCAESRAFSRVVERAAPRARTLALVQVPRTRDREPPSPYRHFGAYALVHRQGFVSNLPMTVGYTRGLLPVRRASDGPPVPASPPTGQARVFSWERHASGWDQFLIRDLDPERPFDYFREHAGEVELLARDGRWRLYRRRR